MKGEAVAIIPARYSSTRLPGKPLLLLARMPMIMHVVERASRARLVSRVIVATDDERIAEAVELIEPSTIDAAIEPLIKDDQIQISTTSEPIASVEDLFNPGVVKVVTDARGFALYFSRSPIPYARLAGELTLEESLRADTALLSNYRKHSGLYAYRSGFLRRFARMEPSPLERLEALEQLRAIENGFEIRVVRVEHRSIGVDTPQDYERVKRLIEEIPS